MKRISKEEFLTRIENKPVVVARRELRWHPFIRWVKLNSKDIIHCYLTALRSGNGFTLSNIYAQGLYDIDTMYKIGRNRLKVITKYSNKKAVILEVTIL